jgi:hypothetical protein
MIYKENRGRTDAISKVTFRLNKAQETKKGKQPRQMIIFYIVKTSSNVKEIEETCSRDRRRSSPTIGCPFARTPRPVVTKTET